MPTKNDGVFNILFQIKETDRVFLSAGGFSESNRIQGRLENDVPSSKLANVSCCSVRFDPTVVNRRMGFSLQNETLLLDDLFYQYLFYLIVATPTRIRLQHLL